jgi:hypothetical protein
MPPSLRQAAARLGNLTCRARRPSPTGASASPDAAAAQRRYIGRTTVETKLRIVTSTPMATLWREDGEIHARRVTRLTHGDIRSLLGAGPVHFVVANVGTPLRWIPISETFDFWKSEVSSRLAFFDSIALQSVSGGLAYVASRWETPGSSTPIVLLEAYH